MTASYEVPWSLKWLMVWPQVQRREWGGRGEEVNPNPHLYGYDELLLGHSEAEITVRDCPQPQFLFPLIIFPPKFPSNSDEL